jgi:Fe2+ or Zn2+ uptake regulation protein
MTKITSKGEMILKTLQKMKGFNTAQEIHSQTPSINLTTVYRNLEKLCSAGHVQKILLANQECAYEYTKTKHHHTVCENCKKIQHIHLSEKTILSIPELSHFDPASIEIVIKGTCK